MLVISASRRLVRLLGKSGQIWHADEPWSLLVQQSLAAMSFFSTGGGWLHRLTNHRGAVALFFYCGDRSGNEAGGVFDDRILSGRNSLPNAAHGSRPRRAPTVTDFSELDFGVAVVRGCIPKGGGSP